MTTYTKDFLSSLVRDGIVRESFQHSTEGDFDITELRGMVARIGTLHTVALHQIIPHLHTSRELCMDRVKSLPPESWQSDPAIFLVFDDGKDVTHLMVDGHHRAMRRHLEGLPDIDAYFVPAQLAPRPKPGWGQSPNMRWGEKDLVDGKLIPRSK